MLKPNKKCAVCKIVRTNKKLLERIYNSSHFIPHSKDTLMDIWRDYNPEGTHAFGYDSIKNHVKMHQFINSADYQEKMLHKVDKEVEAAAVRKAVKAVDAVQSIIDQGTEKLENGELSINTNHLLRASQIKMQHDQKEKDQQLKVLEMIALFASGSGSGSNETQRKRIHVENEQLDRDILDYDPSVPITPGY